MAICLNVFKLDVDCFMWPQTVQTIGFIAAILGKTGTTADLQSVQTEAGSRFVIVTVQYLLCSSCMHFGFKAHAFPASARRRGIVVRELSRMQCAVTRDIGAEDVWCMSEMVSQCGDTNLTFKHAHEHCTVCTTQAEAHPYCGPQLCHHKLAARVLHMGSLSSGHLPWISRRQDGCCSEHIAWDGRNHADHIRHIQVQGLGRNGK